MNVFCFIISEQELFESIIDVVVKRNRGAPESEFICSKAREFWVLLLLNQFFECSNSSGPSDLDGKDAVGSRGSTVNETVEFDIGQGKFPFGVRSCLIVRSRKEVFNLVNCVRSGF